MNKLPDQGRAWEAYGNAMGAALGLELVMRLAIINVRTVRIAERGFSAETERAHKLKLINKVFEGTFGVVLNEFLGLGIALCEDAEFVEAANHAKDARNTLAHRFLAHHMHDLLNERGLDLIAVECVHYQQHFNIVEGVIRAQNLIDWERLETVIIRTERPIAHPFDDLLPPPNEYD